MNMKKVVLLAMLCIGLISLKAQNTFNQQLKVAWGPVDKHELTTPILYDLAAPFSSLTIYGNKGRSVNTTDNWWQMYNEIGQASFVGTVRPPIETTKKYL